MSQAESLILLAVLVLLIWTALVTIGLGLRRYSAAKAGRVPVHFYSVYKGDGETGTLAQHSRHLANLYEAPVLFYITALVVASSGLADMTTAYLAWGFVAARFVHSIIHLTYNKVLHRFFVFLIGILLVLAMLLRTLVAFI